jgi:anti-sigma B factor antagonist
MTMRIDERQDLVVCYLDGELDINTSPQIKKSFDKLISKKTPKVVINFKGLSYVDSSGLATLVEILKNMRIYGGRMRLTNLSAKIRGLFEITKLERLFEIFPDEEAAVSNF